MILNNAELSALDLLKSVGWQKPGDLSLKEIASYCNAFVKEELLNNSEGRILINGESAIITIDSKIVQPSRKNFVIAHELGHFRLHKNIKPLFSDTEKELQEWYAKGKHEQEANSFASELLMPSFLFKEQVKRKNLDLNLIREVSDYFQTSLTATILKYKDLGDFPVTILYIENSVIKWKQQSKDFPYEFLRLGNIVRTGTVARDFFDGEGLEKEPVLVDAIDWFPEDFRAIDSPEDQIFEQNFQIGKNGLLCCLWCE